MLESTIREWTQGPNSAWLTYANVTVPILAAQFRLRSPLVAWWRSMLMSVPMSVIGWLLVALGGYLLGRLGLSGGGLFSWLVSVGFLAWFGYSCGMAVA